MHKVEWVEKYGEIKTCDKVKYNVKKVEKCEENNKKNGESRSLFTYLHLRSTKKNTYKNKYTYR